jgi:hypothetical protein
VNLKWTRRNENHSATTSPGYRTKHTRDSSGKTGEDIQTQSAFSKLLFSLGRAIVKLANSTPEYEKAMDDLQVQMGDEFRKLMD